MKLTFSANYCQILHTFFPGKLHMIILLSLSDGNYKHSKFLLTAISANSAFRKVFDFKKKK